MIFKFKLSNSEKRYLPCKKRGGLALGPTKSRFYALGGDDLAVAAVSCPLSKESSALLGQAIPRDILMFSYPH